MKHLEFNLKQDILQGVDNKCNIPMTSHESFAFEYDSPYKDDMDNDYLDAQADAEWYASLQDAPHDSPIKIYPEFPDGFPTTWTDDMIDRYKKLRIEYIADDEVIDDDVFDYLKELIEDPPEDSAFLES